MESPLGGVNSFERVATCAGVYSTSMKRQGAGVALPKRRLNGREHGRVVERFCVNQIASANGTAPAPPDASAHHHAFAFARTSKGYRPLGLRGAGPEWSCCGRVFEAAGLYPALAAAVRGASPRMTTRTAVMLRDGDSVLRRAPMTIVSALRWRSMVTRLLSAFRGTLSAGAVARYRIRLCA